MALGSTQPLTEIITRDISWNKDGRCIGVTVLKSGSLSLLEPSRPVQGLLYFLKRHQSVDVHFRVDGYLKCAVTIFMVSPRKIKQNIKLKMLETECLRTHFYLKKE
jgi:hypothetical protein